ncbi:MAG: hypothetical protein AUJ72_05660 [Candidatus Omnitrophica bacterium CG1_02_46_14]|nr:MAG: hypothetical protein AUJ72_05660 [Candidatus Omnitrophica bacterium CG1_02_46_14]
MKQYKLSLIALLGIMLMVIGCNKKSNDQANLQGTGFETATTEDLAQLPQANSNTTANQQAGIEVLPIETSPITQGVPAPGSQMMAQLSRQSIETTTTGVEASTEALNHEQQIQTALKNAGFYTGKIDGKIGPNSKKAIEAFQTSKGLKADGKVGQKTWTALESYLNAGPAVSQAVTTD